MKIDAYMKLDNPLDTRRNTEVKKEEITPEIMQELKQMEKQYVECKNNL
jgi:hypothetical protein